MLLVSNLQEFCKEASNLLQVIGYFIVIFKVAIPLIIIVLGMMDFGKAVVSEKDEDVKKQAIKLGRRALAGLVIFFVPTVVYWVFDGVTGANNTDLSTCKKCIFEPGSAECKDATAASHTTY